MKKEERKRKAKSAELFIALVVLSAAAGVAFRGFAGSAPDRDAPFFECAHRDGQEALVPAGQQASLKACSNRALFILGEKMDLNAAGVEDLSMLPGIGEVTAEKIVAARGEAGGFKTVESAASVPGVTGPAAASLMGWTEVVSRDE